MEHLQTQAPVENNSWSPWSQEGTSRLTRHLSGLSSPLNRIDSLPRNDSSLFSSSLPNMFHSKMKLSEAEEAVNDGMHREDECLEELESRTIGNLLPDEDELLDGIDEYTVEDVDIFSSGGGLEMDAQDNYGFLNGFGFQHVNNGPLVAGEHPAGEHPSRTLFVRNINSNVEDTELRSLFEQYGDIRQVYSASKHRGFVMISYYDIRAARNAMRHLQGRLVRRRKLNIHFAIPKDHPSDKDINQGTLVVFNLDASVSNNDLLEIFGAYGQVKEIRETPHKRHHKFIEFYDVRDADAALKALNRSDIAGKRIKLEHSRPGGTRRSTSSLMQQHTQEQEEGAWPSSPVNGGPHPWNGYNHLENGYYKSSKLANGTVSSPTLRNSVIGSHGVKHGIFSPHHPQSLPEYNTGVMGQYASGGNLLNGASSAVFRTESFEGSHFKRASNESPQYGHIGSVPGTNMNGHGNSNGNGSLSSHQFLWEPSTSYNGWPTSFDHGHAHSISPFQSPTLGASASLDHSPFLPEVSSDGSNLMGVHNSYGHIPSSPTYGVLSPHHRSRMYPSSPFENGYARRRAQETNTEQFHLDLERILNGEDTRTTLMIKNIPNKYTSKMLLAAIDEYHRGAYDFLYLPIDFKNKCNVGYAFINMISPLSIIPFYQAFQGKKWEKFNSEKVASLAYARIQGKVALVAHFQNSSLLNEDKRCRPILFHSDGAGEQEPVPMGTNLHISQQGSPTSSSPKDRLF